MLHPPTCKRFLISPPSHGDAGFLTFSAWVRSTLMASTVCEVDFRAVRTSWWAASRIGLCLAKTPCPFLTLGSLPQSLPVFSLGQFLLDHHQLKGCAHLAIYIEFWSCKHTVFCSLPRAEQGWSAVVCCLGRYFKCSRRTAARLILSCPRLE